MKRNWIRACSAMILIAAPVFSTAQEPAVDVLKSVDVIVPARAVEPVAATHDFLLSEGGDVLSWQAAEPGSPSDSQNDPAKSSLAWAFQATTQAPRDGFEERVARLEAQVAELSRQLKSSGAPSAPSAPARVASRAVAPPTVAWTQAAPAIRARAATRAPASTATAIAPGAPIVIHVYVHSAPAAAATTGAAYYYSVSPPAAIATTTAQPTRARLADSPPTAGATLYSAPLTTTVAPSMTVPAFPTPPAATAPVPAAPAIRYFQATPAIPATPAAPATPAQPPTPSVPGVLPPRVEVPSAPSAVAPLTTPVSRLAWDDIPGESVEEK